MTQGILALGSQPGDGTGTPGRAGGALINANFSELYGNAFFFGADTGSVNACAMASCVPQPAAYTLTAGNIVRFSPANANTGPATFQFLTSPPLPIVNLTGGALVGGELEPGSITVVEFTGAAWQILYVNNVTLLQQIYSPVPYPQTPTEVLVNVTPTNTTYPEGDIRRYGGSSAIPDNSSALNAALLVSAAGGSPCLIPSGTWNYTNTVYTGNATYGASSAYGVGQGSILAPAVGVDGLTFVTDPGFNTASARFFRNFQIIGPSAASSNSRGIYVPPGVNRAGGILFQSVVIQNFAYGVLVNDPTGGLWSSTFLQCALYNNYFGYRFYGEAIDVNISGGFVQAGTIAAPTSPPYPNTVGISCDYDAPGNSQGMTLYNVNVYGYATGISANLIFNLAITDCDVSLATIYGIFLGSSQAGQFIKGTYVQLGAANNATAIYIGAVGTALPDKIAITGCNLYGPAGGGFTGTSGVYIGANQNGVTVRDSTIGALNYPFVNGFYGNGAGITGQNPIIEGNSIYASSVAIPLYVSAINARINGNVIQSGTPLTLPGGQATGLQYSNPSTPMTGSVAVAGVTSASVSFAVPLPTGAVYTPTVSLLGATPVAWSIPSQLVSGFNLTFASAFTGTVEWGIRIG